MSSKDLKTILQECTESLQKIVQILRHENIAEPSNTELQVMVNKFYSDPTRLNTLDKQILFFWNKDIKKNLDKGAKKEHYIWYIYPTKKPGDSNIHQTYVNKNRAIKLLRNPLWIHIHKRIYKLMKNGNNIKKIIPSTIDWGRLCYFTFFWDKIREFNTIKGLEGYINMLKEHMEIQPGMKETNINTHLKKLIK